MMGIFYGAFYGKITFYELIYHDCLNYFKELIKPYYSPRFFGWLIIFDKIEQNWTKYNKI